MKIGKNSGFILIMVIIFLNLLSLGVIAQLQEVILLQKSMNQLQRRQQNLRYLELEAKKIFSQKRYLECKKNKMSTNDPARFYSNNPQCCWMNNNQHYCFISIDLGIFPCLTTRNNTGTHHWLLRLSSLEDNEVLQMRYATEEQKNLSCTEEKRKVVTGLQTWQILFE